MINSPLYDVGSLLMDKDQLRRDIEDFKSYIGDRINERYVKQILKAADTERGRVFKSPSKEVQLFLAMRNFTQNPQGIDNLIGLFNLMSTLNRIQREYNDILAENAKRTKGRGNQSLVASEAGKEDFDKEGLDMAKVVLSLALLSLK